jgi:hypothetical protein
VKEHSEVAEPIRSPASRRMRTIVAMVFLAIWLVAVLFDFLVSQPPRLPVWFHVTGVLVLGFVLGINLDDFGRPGRARS